MGFYDFKKTTRGQAYDAAIAPGRTRLLKGGSDKVSLGCFLPMAGESSVWAY